MTVSALAIVPHVVDMGKPCDLGEQVLEMLLGDATERVAE